MRLQEYVETKAYYRWLNRGAGHGDDLADWLEASKNTPDRIWMAWKPSSIRSGGSQDGLIPSLANWEELFAASRHVHVPNRCRKLFFTKAWLEEQDYAHTQGDLLCDCPFSLPPYPFPTPEDLKSRGITIAYHGMVLIRWVISIAHGVTENMVGSIVRHPDTCWQEVPRVTEGFRRPEFKVHGFPKRIPWENCHYNKELYS